MSVLTDEDIDYVIPCRNTTTVVEEINRFAAGMRGSRSAVTTSDGSDSVQYTGVVAVRKKRGGGNCNGPDLPPH